MKCNNGTTTYHLYVVCTMATVGLLGLLGIVLGYFLWPGLAQVNVYLAIGVETALALLIGCYLGSALWMLADIQWQFSSRVLARGCHQLLNTLYPMSVGLSKMVGIPEVALQRSMIAWMNHRVDRQQYHVEDPARLLLLTPHCLQQQRCLHKVTTDAHNCKQCGACQVGDLLRLSNTYGCALQVVTGGTLARLKIKQLRPAVIIAVACERDLVKGMQDTFPLPVIGILNERPEGPCCNTRVPVSIIEGKIQELLYGNKEESSSR